MDGVDAVQTSQSQPVIQYSESTVKVKEPEVNRAENHENGHKFSHAKIIDVTG